MKLFEITFDFKAWFKNSKVVDKNGKPLIVYHGTKAAFDSFKTPAWFTPDKKFADAFSAEWGDGTRTSDSKVIGVYLSMQKPIYTDSWDVTEGNAYDESWRKAQMRKGFDGIIFEDEGEVEYVVFKPEQIRRA